VEFAGDECVAEGLVVAVDCDRADGARPDAHRGALLAAAIKLAVLEDHPSDVTFRDFLIV
jgi:hypothetical protein